MKLLLLFSVALIIVISCHAKTGFGPGEQDWGFVDVRKGAHMFWWLYYTTADVKSFTERPLVIWLQGGPGGSSTGFGNFGELGPLDLDLKPRNFTWVKDANVLFIDNPVGTGFSYVDSYDALTKDNKQIALDLVELMKQFYNQLSEFKKVPLYITSESYGGKMTAEFGLILDQEIKAGNIDCNLVGVGLGDSWISPIDSVLTWAPFLLHMGAVDQQGHDTIMEYALETKKAFDNGEFERSTTLWGITEGVIMDVAHNVDFYNVLEKIPSFRSKNNKEEKPVLKPNTRIDDSALEGIMNGKVNKELNITQRWGAQSNAVFSYLREDFMKPVTDIVEYLLNTTKVKVAIFTGQLDLIVDTPGTVLWIDRLRWSGRDDWKRANRNAISVNGYNEGYKKEVGNLGLYWVNRAGHMVPADNPAAMDYVLRRLTDDYAGYKPAL